MAFPPRFNMPPYGNFPPPMYFSQMSRPANGTPPTAPAITASKEPTTVFIGNISEKCTDEFMQKILEVCGKTVSWKRIQGSNGKMQGFGFCNYEDPLGTLCALRVLNDFQIGDKKLVVKAEDKVREALRKWVINHRKRLGRPDMKLKDDEMPADEEDLKKDEEVRLKILNWIETDHPELITVAEDGELSDKEKETKEKKDKVKEKDEPKRDADRSDRKDEAKRRRSRSRSQQSRVARDKHRRSRTGTPKTKRRHGSSTSRSSSGSSRSSSSNSSGSRSRSRSPKSKKRRERSASRSSEDSDDARERRALRKQVKEKEQAYLARLRKWESREKQKSSKYEKEESRGKEKKARDQREAKRLKLFMEDYDDETDDVKYYKSSMLFTRKREFEREREADQKDRLREQQEIEELKKQIAAENHEKDNEKIDEEARKRHREQEEKAMRRLRADSGSPNPHQPLGQNTHQAESSSSSGSDDGGSDGETTASKAPPRRDVGSSRASIDNDKLSTNGASEAVNGGGSNSGGWKAIDGAASQIVAGGGGGGPPTVSTKSVSSTLAAAAAKLISPSVTSPHVVGVGKPPITQRLGGVFGDEDDELNPMFERKKKLGSFQVTREERMQVMSVEERKEISKGIIRKIPTSKEDLFAYPIEWDMIDTKLMETRVRPWVSKKVSEFLGEEENQLVEFICDKIVHRCRPETILTDVAMIIDEDADMFVVKMWRLLIFESHAKKMGIS